MTDLTDLQAKVEEGAKNIRGVGISPSLKVILLIDQRGKAFPFGSDMTEHEFRTMLIEFCLDQNAFSGLSINHPEVQIVINHHDYKFLDVSKMIKG